ncbi:CBS-HotDog domain-containing transcription factor SpxR [Streptococcus hongkongensis]|nr:CBS domain containing protein [Streptococcus uberis]
MSKHQEILNYLEKLAVGKRVSVRSISNHLNVSDGTAYRAIKEAENRGIVETKPRSGTVRVEKKSRVSIDKLTFTEIARISDSKVVAGHEGLGNEFSKFFIGAMTKSNVSKYLVKGGLLIVGDREHIQLLALESRNAILVTGGFSISKAVIETADSLGIPVMVSQHDTFTVATLINHALMSFRIKTDLKTVDQIMLPLSRYGFLYEDGTIEDLNQLIKKTKQVRFPVIKKDGTVTGFISMRDVVDQKSTVCLKEVMTKSPITTTPSTSLANVSQKMIFEDLNMLPVVDDHQKILGVVTRRLALENMQNNQSEIKNTYSTHLLAHMEENQNIFSIHVEPRMIDKSGNLTQGVVSEIIKEITLKVFNRKYQKNVIIEQMMIYFLHAAQIDDQLVIHPKIITETRRSGTIDIELYVEKQIIAKAVVSTRIN